MTPDDARFLTLTAEAAQGVIDEQERCPSCGSDSFLVTDGHCDAKGCRPKAEDDDSQSWWEWPGHFPGTVRYP